MSQFNGAPEERALHRYSLHPPLVACPMVCFVGALLTDIAYWRTHEMLWADFSAWLLLAGIVLGVIGIVIGIWELVTSGPFHGPTGPYCASGIVAVILAVFNFMIHSRDAWTSVVPGGVILSALTVVVLAFAGLIAGRASRGVVP
jgi:uncharacterized membrane protein